MFWTVIEAAMSAELDAAVTVLLLTGPVDPLLTLRILEDR